MSNVRSISKIGHVALAILLALMLSPFALYAGVQRAYAGNATAIYGSSDGANLTISIPVSDSSEYWDQTNFKISYPDGSSTDYIMVSGNGSSPKIMNAGWQDVSGASIVYDKQSSSFGVYTVMLPLSGLSNSSDFTVSCGSKTATAAQLGISAPSSGDSGQQGGGQTSGTDQGGGTDAGDSGQQGGTEQGGNEQGGGTQDGGGTSIGSLTPTASGKITVDGENEDWSGIDALASNSSKIPEWKLARDVDGNVYLMFDGTADTEWDYTYQWENLEITQNGSTKTIQVVNLSEIGADLVIQNNAHHNTSAPFVVEAMIPASYFTDANATIKLVGEQVVLSDIPVVDGNDVTPDLPTTYEGIVIDGAYADWAPVTKYPSNDVDHELQNVAMVWDGDMVYLYLEETPGTLGAYNAGTHGNGKYEIITDLGNRLVFQVNYDGTVSGIEGVACAHVGDQWEISIPASNLPDYLKSISFGLYQADPMITGVENLQGTGEIGTFNGIVYDGQYGDWENYPHHLIEYATAGTQEDVPDAEGALYTDEETGILYGHVKVTMQRHLDAGNGHEFTTGVTFRFNDNTTLEFYPRSTTTDESGNINWNPQMRDLPNGTYEFSLMSRDAWGNSTNLSNVNEHDYEYGRMYVTISDTCDECELYLDLSLIAEKLGIDSHDMKTVAAQFINIGDEWITAAGTSTMPFVGIGLGLITVAGVLGTRKLKASAGENSRKADDEAA